MPWSATTTIRVVVGSASRSCSRGHVDRGELRAPLRRGDAVAVPGPVEVAVVQVGQRRACAARRLHRDQPLAHPVGADEVDAARARLGEPGAAELALVDVVVCTPAAASRAKAVGCGCHSCGSTSLLHISALRSRSVPGMREV